LAQETSLARGAPDERQAHDGSRGDVQQAAEPATGAYMEVDPILDPRSATRRNEGVGVVKTGHWPGKRLVHEALVRDAIDEAHDP
jgi:hypothetical protein